MVKPRAGGKKESEHEEFVEQLIETPPPTAVESVGRSSGSRLEYSATRWPRNVIGERLRRATAERASQAYDLRQSLAQRLQPHLVRRHFLEAFRRVGGSARRRGPGCCEIKLFPGAVQRIRQISTVKPETACFRRFFDRRLAGAGDAFAENSSFYTPRNRQRLGAHEPSRMARPSIHSRRDARG
jgi:hypothetical protein